MPFTPDEVAIVLKANPIFVQRVLASDESYFIGPAKELLLEVAKRPAPGAPGTSPAAPGPRVATNPIAPTIIPSPHYNAPGAAPVRRS